MGRRLTRTVIVRNDRHEVVAFGPNDDVPAWAAEQITNPDVWADDAPERGETVPVPTPDEPPGLEQLVRVGATPDEVAAIREAWASLPEDERGDVDEDGTDAEALDALEQARAMASEHGVSLADALRSGALPVVGDGDAGGQRDEEPAEKPPANGSTKAWRAYAVAQGMSEEDAKRRNRDELVALYGS